MSSCSQGPLGGEKALLLQDKLLAQACGEQIPVTLWLLNGSQFRGVVLRFDEGAILLDCDGQQNLVCRQAVCALTPAKAIQWE